MHGQVVPLFYRDKLQVYLSEVLRRIPDHVDSIPAEQFRAASDEELVEHLMPRFVWTPITLYEDQKDVQLSEIMVNITRDQARDTSGGRITHVKGVKVDVSVPFSGGTGLWHMTPKECPSRHTYGYIDPPSGDSGTLHIIKEQPNDVPMEHLKPEIENELSLIRSFIESQTRELNKYNQEVSVQILSFVQGRRHRLNLHQTLPNILGIPLKRKEGAPNFEPIEIRRKLVRPLPSVPQQGVAAEQGIPEGEYQHILKVIRHEGRTFETTPKTYRVHDEEELRDIMLAHLNGHYEGSASGEAFRKSGKTDIKIEWGDRSAFVSEHKVWRGPKEMSEAIGQLLSYLTWRDGKAALLIFNKDVAGFTDIIAKIPNVLKAHPSFKQDLRSTEKGEWKVQLSCPDDADRSITVTVFVFNLYVSPNK